MSFYLLDQTLPTLSIAQQQKALLTLLCVLAYREGDYALTSGRQSSYYINCKTVTLHPQGAFLVGQCLLHQLPCETEAVAGMTLGADPILTAVSLASVYPTSPAPLRNLPALIVRKQPKGHGTQAWLEGLTLAPNTCVWILEDVVTTGGSALRAAERIQAAGYHVGGILALVDRLEGAAEACAQAGLTFRALFTIEQLRHHHHQLQQI
ncbi:MAG: orotate phosphoribosyltransferase [Synechococcaceae cyanobacterium SM2_3_1]|nr:orotate phosphoribosyltransferase [Synechococcaceae cyanobacterium SM2_3_1]